MRRAYIVSLIAVGVVVFLGVSALLARAFSVSGAEQGAIASVLRAEARGDQPAIVSAIEGCAADAACQARATVLAATLRHPGNVSIVQLVPSTQFSLGPTLGTARVAWIVGGSLPRVQCVRVRHSGNIFAGFRVLLLKVSTRIPSGSDCPSTF
jgi:hypothetical protein